MSFRAMLDLHTCCVYLLCQEECLLAGWRQVPGNLACGTCVGRCGAKGAFDAEQYALTRKQQMTCQMQKFGRAPTRLQRGRRHSACGGIRAIRAIPMQLQILLPRGCLLSAISHVKATADHARGPRSEITQVTFDPAQQRAPLRA